MYYTVESITGRRVRPEDGVLEYQVTWEGYKGAGATTWEPRQSVTESCAGQVQAVDQACMERADASIAAWREAHGLSAPPQTAQSASGKRARSPEGSGEGVEVLTSVLLRVPATTPAAAPEEETAPVILLGEVVLTEEAATVLSNPSRRGRRGGHHGKGARSPTVENTSELCAPAVSAEKAWRDRFGVSLMHSCVACSSHSRVQDSYTYEVGAAAKALEHQLSGGTLDILGLAPVEVTKSGTPFQEPFTFVPWIGAEEGERLRRQSTAEAPAHATAAQELLRPQREHMVVRYALSGGGPSGGAEEKAGDEGQPRRVVASMPLTVFRTVFPQLLLDYLLEHSVVLTG